MSSSPWLAALSDFADASSTVQARDGAVLAAVQKPSNQPDMRGLSIERSFSGGLRYSLRRRVDSRGRWRVERSALQSICGYALSPCPAR